MFPPELIVPLAVSFVVLPVAVLWAMAIYQGREAKRRRAEDKVRLSRPILKEDINVLKRANSPLLTDAMALLQAQNEHGRNLGG